MAIKPLKEVFEFEQTVNVNGHNLRVQFGVTEVFIGNDGIGEYEFWGARGYDRGTDFVESFVMTHLFAWSERRQRMVRVSPRLKKLIDFSEELCMAISDPIMGILGERENRAEARYLASHPEISIFDE